MMCHKERVFSGVQATGNLHLGNYLGALKQWVALQQHYECLYCVVDMHALTTNPNPIDLQRATYHVVASYLACGIDPKRSIVFNQARVYQHSELAWIFNCIARLGWMNRMTQFKDKAGKNREAASLGLFVYPTLMAADILLYKATHIPVGEDQKQHIELTRDIAQKFNHDYADRIKQLGLVASQKEGAAVQEGFFPLPQPLLGKVGMRVMSLRDGTKKMSKSDPSEFSRINLSDCADTIVKKIRKAKTDPLPLPYSLEELQNRPEADNLLTLYSALSEENKDSVLARYMGKDFAPFKADLAALLVEKIAPIGAEMKRLLSAPDYIESVLKEGAERASLYAEQTMKDVRYIVGFLTGRLEDTHTASSESEFL